MLSALPSVDRRLLEAACEACARLHARNLLAAGDGNISLRLSDGRIALTPAGTNKARLRPEGFAFLDAEGSVLLGEPSSERPMHLAVLHRCPEARAVLHAHPPTVIAWTLAHPDLRELPSEGLPEVILAAGGIPIVPYARPGTTDLGDGLSPFLPAHRLLVLARHGALCWGESLDEATDGMERVEHVAQILKAAMDLGRISPLPPEEIAALRSIRAGLGPRVR